VGIVLLVTAGWVVRVHWQLPAQESFRDYRSFAAEVRRRAPAPEPLVFFRTEAHALAFHVGRPLTVLVKWEDLQRRLAGPGPHHVVLPPDCVAECPRFLPGFRVEELARNTASAGGAHERPLVLVRLEPVRAGGCTTEGRE
jgi:hypothetical protein